ncbi:MAG: flagellar protein FliS [Alphaproteobacteria bacterium]
MENYNEIFEKEKKIFEKEVLVDDTINKSKLSKYEIIGRMFNGLVNEIEELKQLLFTDLSVTLKSKEKAEKISKIAFALQTCLDLDNKDKDGKKIAEDLNWLYRFIRYMSKRVQDNEDMNYVQPAFKIATELKEAWEGIPEESKKIN